MADMRFAILAKDAASGTLSKVSKGIDNLSKHAEGLSSIGDKLKMGFAAAGVAGAIALGAGFAQALETQDATAMLSAQIGATPEMAKSFGKIAGDLYANAYGQSMGEVTAAIKTVWQNGVVDEDATDAQIKSVTGKMLSLTQAMGADIGATSRAVGQMVRTGIAKNADEAMDILAKGMENGADKSGDLLDTFNEYPTQFRKLGISGAQAMGLITQSIKAGARDSDVAADALKEFSIRAVDGSKTSAAGFKALGLDAEKMTAQIAKGGPQATAGLQTVLQKFKEIKDPVKQSQAMVALFGTQSEDLGKALNAMDLTRATAMMGDFAGSAGEVDKKLGATARAKWESFKRSLTQKLSGFALEKVLPIAEKFGGILQEKIFPALAATGKWLAKYSGWLIPIASGIGAVTAAIWVASTATKIWAAGQMILNAAMALNPIGAVVLAIIALVAIVMVAWKRSEAFRSAVLGIWGGIKTGVTASINGIKFVVQKVWSWITGYISWSVGLWRKAISTAVGLIVAYFQWWVGNVKATVRGISRVAEIIRDAFGKAKQWATDRLNALLGVVRAIPKKIKDVFSGAKDWLKNAGKDLIDGFLSAIHFGDIKKKFKSLTKFIPSWKGPPETDKVLLKPNAHLIMDGLAAGIEEGFPAVKAKLGQVTTGITASVAAPITAPAVNASGTVGTSAQPIIIQVQGHIVDKLGFAAAVEEALTKLAKTRRTELRFA